MQEIGSLPVVTAVAFGLIALAVEVSRNRGIDRTVGLDDDPRCLFLPALAEPPFDQPDERLRNEDRIEAVRQPDDTAPELFSPPVAGDLDAERNPLEYPLRNLRQPLRLGKPVIVEVQVIARDDDGDVPVAGFVFPLPGGDIEEAVGHRLEKQVGRELHAAHAHRTLHPVVRRRESPDIPDERLSAQLLQLPGGKVAAPQPDRLERADPFRKHKVIAPHERIGGIEDRHDIAVSLHRGEHDGHAHDPGEGETYGLRDAQMAAQQFPKRVIGVRVLW